MRAASPMRFATSSPAAVVLLACACASTPKRPPVSGPVGATGTCAAEERSQSRSAGDGGSPSFDTETAQVSFIVERGELREVVAVFPVLGPERLRAQGLHVPLVVGEWVSVTLRLSNAGDSGAGVRLRLRVLGDDAEIDIGASSGPLRGTCAWGIADRDTL